MPRLDPSARSHRLLVPLLLAVVSLLLGLGVVSDAPRDLGPTAANAVEGPDPVPVAAVEKEIGLVFAERDAKLTRLGRLHASAPGLESRLVLEREMADVKRRAILEMFRIQRRYAIERDDAATVDLMDAAIRRIEHRLAKGAVLPPEDVPARETAHGEEVKP